MWLKIPQRLANQSGSKTHRTFAPRTQQTSRAKNNQRRQSLILSISQAGHDNMRLASMSVQCGGWTNKTAAGPAGDESELKLVVRGAACTKNQPNKNECFGRGRAWIINAPVATFELLTLITGDAHYEIRTDTAKRWSSLLRARTQTQFAAPQRPIMTLCVWVQAERARP